MSIWLHGPRPGLRLAVWPVEVCRMPRPSVSAPPEGAGAYAELTGAGTGVGLWHSWGKCLQGMRKLLVPDSQ